MERNSMSRKTDGNLIKLLAEKLTRQVLIMRSEKIGNVEFTHGEATLYAKALRQASKEIMLAVSDARTESDISPCLTCGHWHSIGSSHGEF
jgi:hypothetical protein